MIYILYLTIIWCISVNLHVFSDNLDDSAASLTLGDMKLTDEQKTTKRLRNAYILTRKWPNGVVPYVMHPDIAQNKARKTAIDNAIRMYSTSTCIQWKPRTNENNYVQFMDGGSGQCYSYVGMIQTVPQNISIGRGCETAVGVIIHEMMHAVGFMHEHMRPDRDGYITVVTEKIQPDNRDQFIVLSATNVDLQKLSYDYGSVMHYPSYAFSRDGGRTIVTKDIKDQSKIGQRSGFSKCDLEKVNKWYGCTKHITNDPLCAKSAPVKPNITSTTPGTIPLSNNCTDSSTVVCKSASATNCFSYPGRYLKACKKSCNNCDGKRCEDTNIEALANTCKSVKRNSCTNRTDRMLCPKSCGLC